MKLFFTPRSGSLLHPPAGGSALGNKTELQVKMRPEGTD
jgi:hypothetical protein